MAPSSTISGETQVLQSRILFAACMQIMQCVFGDNVSSHILNGTNDSAKETLIDRCLCLSVLGTWLCRCRVGENWWYRGEHCEEYVSEPLVVGIAIASVAGFLLVASGVIFFLARTLRDQYDKDESQDPIR